MNRKHQEFEAKLIEQFLQQLSERATSSDNKEVMAEWQTLRQCYDKMRSSNERSKRQQGQGQERGEVDELSAGWAADPEPQIVPSAKPAPSTSATQQVPTSSRQNAAAGPARASNSVSSGGSNGSKANQSSSTAAQSNSNSSRYEFN